MPELQGTFPVNIAKEFLVARIVMGQLHVKLVLECGMRFNQRISSRYELPDCPIDILRIRIGQNFELADKYLRHTFCIPAIAFLHSWVALALSKGQC